MASLFLFSSVILCSHALRFIRTGCCVFRPAFGAQCPECWSNAVKNEARQWNYEAVQETNHNIILLVKKYITFQHGKESTDSNVNSVTLNYSW